MGYIEDIVDEIIQASNDRIAADIYYNYLDPYFRAQKFKKEEPPMVIPKKKKGEYVYLSGNEGSSGGTSSECAGTYLVSGYTRADGKEVGPYMRTCGAAHAGQAEEMPDNTDEQDSGTIVLEGRVEKTQEGEPPAPSEESAKNGKASGNKEEEGVEIKEELTFIEKLQKILAQSEVFNQNLPLKDYYKIGLDLADKNKKVVSNDRNRVYKAKNLPESVDKKVVFNKIIENFNLNLSNAKDIDFLNNTTVVVPNQTSKIVDMVKKSKTTEDFIKKYYSEILKRNNIGKFDTKYITKKSLDEFNLYATLKKVDINNLKRNSDGSISFVICDIYDFEHIEHNDNEEYPEPMVVDANNRANKQQQVGELVPYVLYIPVTYTKNEIQKIFNM